MIKSVRINNTVFTVGKRGVFGITEDNEAVYINDMPYFNYEVLEREEEDDVKKNDIEKEGKQEEKAVAKNSISAI